MIYTMKQKLIALDIDGTLTDKNHLIPPKVNTYLHKLYNEGWNVVLLTGRPFSFAKYAIQNIDFPYYLGLQNGADIIKMPEKRLAKRAYLTFETVKTLDDLYQDLPSDFLIYSGYEAGDFCYYRSKRFPATMASYLEKLKKLSDAPWRDWSDTQLDQNEFPLIKCVGFKDELESIEKKLQDVATSLIVDPVSAGYYHLILVTHTEATKGHGLARIQHYLNIDGPTIAAGDDMNDIPMLEKADIAIAMSTAPTPVLEKGDIIAAPSTDLGIIPALQQAIEQC